MDKGGKGTERTETEIVQQKKQNRKQEMQGLDVSTCMCTCVRILRVHFREIMLRSARGPQMHTKIRQTGKGKTPPLKFNVGNCVREHGYEGTT